MQSVAGNNPVLLFPTGNETAQFDDCICAGLEHQNMMGGRPTPPLPPISETPPVLPRSEALPQGPRPERMHAGFGIDPDNLLAKSVSSSLASVPDQPEYVPSLAALHGWPALPPEGPLPALPRPKKRAYSFPSMGAPQKPPNIQAEPPPMPPLPSTLSGGSGARPNALKRATTHDGVIESTSKVTYDPETTALKYDLAQQEESALQDASEADIRTGAAREGLNDLIKELESISTVRLMLDTSTYKKSKAAFIKKLQALSTLLTLSASNDKSLIKISKELLKAFNEFKKEFENIPPVLDKKIASVQGIISNIGKRAEESKDEATLIEGKIPEIRTETRFKSRPKAWGNWLRENKII
jgi:hypothetical protein